RAKISSMLAAPVGVTMVRESCTGAFAFPFGPVVAASGARGVFVSGAPPHAASANVRQKATH
ncbi:MAG TPA: hypothetical protein VHU80_10250, partial [Polyangiaceae bacterium]|nr:hypothetical protein [Polyangiaceae bacterium]